MPYVDVGKGVFTCKISYRGYESRTGGMKVVPGVWKSHRYHVILA